MGQEFGNVNSRGLVSKDTKLLPEQMLTNC